MYKPASVLTGLLLFIFVMTSYGFGDSEISNPETKKAAVKNLLMGLNSENCGLRMSSAFILGEIKAEEAVIPLMHMLRTEECEDFRIVAALALYKINNPKGIFAIKQAIRFDDSERVRKMCSNFYFETLKIKYGIDGYPSAEDEVAFK
jgi:hypothetical protein